MFAPGKETGFLRDADLPPLGTSAKVGGRLLDGTESAIAKAVDGVREFVVKELEDALGEFDYAALCEKSLGEALQAMAQTVGASVPPAPQKAFMVPVEFAETGRPLAKREDDIGRVLSGIESVDGRDWLQVMLTGVTNQLQSDHEDPDDIEAITGAIRRQSEHPGTQIRQFLDFLEDEAMARVRMQVCMRIMDAVAAQSPRAGFKSYVRSVRDAFEAFAGHEGDPLPLEVGRVYGVANDTDLAEQLRKALFYQCLPVWCEGSVQLFERRIDPQQNQPTVREVSYRFRVNGIKPETGRSAFEARLKGLEERLLDSPATVENVKRHVAELVFLYLVLPPSIHEEAKGDVRTRAAAVAAALKDDPLHEITRIHRSLLSRVHVMEEIAREMVQLLKRKSTSFVTLANRAADKLYISIQKDIFEWPVVRGLASEKEEVLKKSEGGPDTVAWFSRIRVSREPWPSSVASIWVETNLQERSLTVTGEPHEVTIGKSLDLPVLPVRLVPYLWRDDAWLPAVPDAGLFDTGRGVDLEYSLRPLTLTKRKDNEKALAEQLRAATVAAMGVLLYVVLFELALRAKAARPGLTMTLVRLQHSGKQKDRESDAQDGNTAIYALSQALEKALARELPVKLQGITTLNDADDSAHWRKRGSLAALLGGQPVRFAQEGSLDKVAVLSYVTRPCDVHPAYPASDGHLFVSRTYLADSEGGQTLLKVGQMLSRRVDSRKDFGIPHLILEQIAQLRKAGYQHILMLSHHYGNRHRGRAAERHSPHATLEFLDEATTRFDDVFIYPLRRDVFPATRLRPRDAMESAFEVLRYDAHQKMYQEGAANILRSLRPIYTFATLHVVGDESRPQSGFCTYFFDSEHRIANFGLQESTRANILGTNEADAKRRSLVSVLRAIHFMESEKPSDKNRLLPVLDPFDWATPTRTAAAGELEVVSRRGGRTILLSLPALLWNVTRVLHKEKVGDE
ncbi:hypothetical protein JJ685_08755 [Ramlibacter monticola]|uniref:Uncharacterized protein n=1 Tax=Ramlibacter monticola TaxID=1926872 RepID=A0A936YZY7_9BURK|nr:hypothetical protein [Ramlibacter monticola]MBL0391226.1 hypothetical protein [Ramlibacter monticola]